MLHTHTRAHTHRHTHTHRHRHRHRHTHRYRYTQIHTDTHRYTQIHTDTHRYTQIHTDTHRYTQIHTDTHRYTQIHADTHRYTQIHIHIHRYTYTCIQLRTHMYRQIIIFWIQKNWFGMAFQINKSNKNARVWFCNLLWDDDPNCRMMNINLSHARWQLLSVMATIWWKWRVVETLWRIVPYVVATWTAHQCLRSCCCEKMTPQCMV